MKTLNEQIREKAEHLDRFEPDAGHFENFKSKLNHRKQQKMVWNVFKYAASVSIIALITSLAVVNYPFIENLANLNNTVPEEIENAQFYYTSVIDNKMETIKKLDPQFCFEELEIEPDPNMQLKNEFNSLPINQKMFNVLLIQYQSRIEILDKIIDNLNNVTPLKHKHHENIRS